MGERLASKGLCLEIRSLAVLFGAVKTNTRFEHSLIGAWAVGSRTFAWCCRSAGSQLAHRGQPDTQRTQATQGEGLADASIKR